MSFPVPHAGLVIRYSYLWAREAKTGQEEGVKDRPCAVILAVPDAVGELRVLVLPITHTPPSDPAAAVEIPSVTKERLGLDFERSWIVVSELNTFTWPGPDLRPQIPGNPASVAYGTLPPGLFRIVRERFLAVREAGRLAAVRRS